MNQYVVVQCVKLNNASALHSWVVNRYSIQFFTGDVLNRRSLCYPCHILCRSVEPSPGHAVHQR